ncbi:4-alpha-glucanotransferase [Dysgonomonas sp. 25]|uniref:4-alpha-glucanotransferase n=1 Tax=Dysgonomonas sp. 25 TaxID=2302933 RepID=UPI0013D6B8DB|nr:4-alpha-glucanotransferase [Dysgonomonas sp. 25]NDV68109.1 hypothetical protein [Dysgonomonas sp. 25]
MNILFSIDYETQWGEELYICGSVAALGNNNEREAVRMEYASLSRWQVTIEIPDNIADITYYYLVKKENRTFRKEGALKHTLHLQKGCTFQVNDSWFDTPEQKYLYSSAFTSGFYGHASQATDAYPPQAVLLKVRCPYVARGQKLIISGSSDYLGNWDESKALSLSYNTEGEWQIALDANCIQHETAYKFAIYDTNEQKTTYWWEGEALILHPFRSPNNTITVNTFLFHHPAIYPKTSGVAIPVFSLRTHDSFGIGDFLDLKKLVDWAVATGMKVIQLLPINDTTVTHSWTDSYPYSAISIYALHPIYFGIKDYPLHNKESYARYESWASELNKQKVVDYEAALRLKQSYLKELFVERGDAILQSEEYQTFFRENENWLFPYACFCYLRDFFHTAEYWQWNEYAGYDRDKLSALISYDNEATKAIQFIYFTQYLLDKQLKGVKEYAHRNGVILKGDIPIGVNKTSVDTWVEPQLFHLDAQAGAPPDAFSTNGQNWGFPTYNWEEKAKDEYSWWSKRFQKMADFFDAYRIDHILGFFRIWEIPVTSVQGLLGYFNPALPYSAEEIGSFGFPFEAERMTTAYVDGKYLHELFGDYTDEALATYLHPNGNGLFSLKEFCNTQSKIQQIFQERTNDKSNQLRDALYHFCNDVLFIRDKGAPDLFHPRIAGQETFLFRDLDDAAQKAFTQLHDEFFFRRHTQFWADSAMKKLPKLIDATQMLVCGEDLGMIPDCVPAVMKDLQILSLEIERMPKETNLTFAKLWELPYLSVCTTSTHDMSPIRLWWREDKELIQRYYNEVLWKEGKAPKDCTTGICHQILLNHLNSPSMLTIIPLQDWLSMSEQYRNPNPEEERINIPANPKHYWRYRMHLNIEDLTAASELNNSIREMLSGSNRASL